MTKKKSRRSRPGGDSVAKNSRSQGHKTNGHTQVPSQSNQPYEQDVKRRVGQFVGAGEPALMKK
jgi:hypothetical protein